MIKSDYAHGKHGQPAVWLHSQSHLLTLSEHEIIIIQRCINYGWIPVMQIWNKNKKLKYYNSLPRVESILSHSSRMKCLMFFRDKTLLLTRAWILPGVPTTMCGQFFLRTSSSFFTFIPPKKTAILTLFMYLLKRSYSLLIWKANSLVWAITRTETCFNKSNKTIYECQINR